MGHFQYMDMIYSVLQYGTFSVHGHDMFSATVLEISVHGHEMFSATVWDISVHGHDIFIAYSMGTWT